MSMLYLVRFGLLSGRRLGKSCSLGFPYVLFVFLLFVMEVIFRFGFEGWIWVLIALVHGLCILITFVYKPYELFSNLYTLFTTYL